MVTSGRKKLILMAIPNNYSCDGQINIEEVLELMQCSQAREKTKGEEIHAYPTYGIKNMQIRDQRTWLQYNPNPVFVLDNGPYIIYATIAYVSEKIVYAKEFMKYPVLHEFDSGREAVDFYKQFVSEIETKNKMYPQIVYHEMNIHIWPEEIYKIDGEWRAESWKREHKYHK